MIRVALPKQLPYGARQLKRLPCQARGFSSFLDRFRKSPSENHSSGSAKDEDTRKISKVRGAPQGISQHRKTEWRINRHKVFRISEEVRAAVASNQPVVALETTIYTHGFPYPDNVALALELEAIVRKNGGIPATIGVLDGVIRVGLDTEEITRLASAAGNPETMKVSRRDTPYITGMALAGHKLNGGTTVAGTMMIAMEAGIKVFGTGGLGGVHRGGQDTLDISADLTELGRTPVAVVSSGCKSFLDLSRTLEYLETQGVPVCTFADGRRGDIDLPSFYSRDSGIRSPLVVQNAAEAAAMIFSGELMNNRSGMLFANPLPEEFSIPKTEIDIAIDKAVKEATEQGHHGHLNTPFILSRIKELTKGNSVVANRALIHSNVTMATYVAVELARLKGETTNPAVSNFQSRQTPSNIKQTPSKIAKMPSKIKTDSNEITQGEAINQHMPNADIIVFGSIAMDISCDYIPRAVNTIDESTSVPTGPMTDAAPHMKTSNIGTIAETVGGVGHNVTLAAHLVAGELTVRLCSLVATDRTGDEVVTQLRIKGLDTQGIRSITRSISPKDQHPKDQHPTHCTARYVAMNDGKKDLILAMADMSIFDTCQIRQTMLPGWIQQTSKGSKWSVIDANWSPSSIKYLLDSLKGSRSNARIAFEPVSVPKSIKLFQPTTSTGDGISIHPFPHNVVDLATPNQFELAAMHASAKQHEYFESDEWWKAIDSFGIPSSGARERFVALTNKKMTDEGIPLQTIQLLPFIPIILTKLGPEGVLMTELLKPGDKRLKDPNTAPYILSRNANGSAEIGGVYMRLFPAVEQVQDVVSVNGVGDTFLGVIIAGLASGARLDKPLIDLAQKAAVLTLRSREAVSPELKVLRGEFNGLNR
ncbi:Uncharacterized protein BP5553_10577 [Venustampulla echinocandica]|uniref:Carbohydrate kinase PfkB domain-containing protein n=1 Tax=Venustampulla echinocandica TaxID=2656787 RepID=A0A370T8Y8_9HELO|nr:Uncharacterized protein BP5553_10577 [Venustampulla echinocandica]RDL29950.1 Uncharacterized protein BP5553_10577 [Venustampulla echinocandica]